jgi:hypothetical protein
MESMSTNDVWDIVEIPKGSKTVSCKWVYNTKYDSKGNVKRFKARLVNKPSHREKESIILKLFLFCLANSL